MISASELRFDTLFVSRGYNIIKVREAHFAVTLQAIL